LRRKVHIEKQLNLVDAIKANNEVVLKKLYLDNYNKVEVYILNNNGSMPQAKDTYQEAFIAVWKNIKEDKFIPTNETAIQGYIYQISKNKWLDFLRSSNYKKTVSFSKTNTENKFTEITENNDVAEVDIKLQNTMQAFSKLGDACQELLKLFYFSKKSLRKIAEELAIEEASARNKKYRCIQKLRKLALSPNSY
jgi:RNA polymerase sigma factor (sigma-70 family)